MNTKSPQARQKLIVGLDLDQPEKAMQLAQTLSPYVGCFKIGPRLALRWGASGITALGQLAPVFLDFKFHDIPSTTDSAVRTAFELGARYVTVHAAVGPETLSRLAKTEKELQTQRDFQILAVTVLTSFSEKSLPSNWKAQALSDHVQALVKDVKNAGLSGVVCSPLELPFLKNQGLFLVTPGIRMPGADLNDQVRILSPAEALRDGASALVVARPIIAASDPVAAAQAFLQNMESAP